MSNDGFQPLTDADLDAVAGGDGDDDDFDGLVDGDPFGAEAFN